MDEDELNKQINCLHKNNSQTEAKVGIFYLKNDDAISITGNESGLQLLAAEILKASKNIEEFDERAMDKVSINLNREWLDTNSHSVFIKSNTEYERPIKDYPKENWKDKIAKYGCLLLIGFLAVSLIVGVVTIIKLFL